MNIQMKHFCNGVCNFVRQSQKTRAPFVFGGQRLQQVWEVGCPQKQDKFKSKLCRKINKQILPLPSEVNSWASALLNNTQKSCRKMLLFQIEYCLHCLRPHILFKFNALLKMRAAVAVCLLRSPRSSKSWRGGVWDGLWVQSACLFYSDEPITQSDAAEPCWALLTCLCDPTELRGGAAGIITVDVITADLCCWLSAGRSFSSVSVMERNQTAGGEVCELNRAQQVTRVLVEVILHRGECCMCVCLAFVSHNKFSYEAEWKVAVF